MDTLIFGGLLTSLIVVFQQRSRHWVIAVWFVMLVVTTLLMAHHITSGLGLGLNW